MEITVADCIMAYLGDYGIRHIFMLPGGGAMYLNDALARSDQLTAVPTLHEQAAAIAAEAYAKISGGLAVVMVTSGPGATNTITGVSGAWLDSSPVLIISGQVKRSDLKGQSGLRQRGMQEVDIVSMVRPITKYAALIEEPSDLLRHLDQATDIATSGRPGPVWLDIPLDVQASTISINSRWCPSSRNFGYPHGSSISKSAEEVIDLLRSAERPVVLGGQGVILGSARNQFRTFIERLKVPTLLTWPAIDLIPSTHPLCLGRPGSMAPRYANFALQNSDLILSIGARLDLSITGYAKEHFARAAKIVMVDIDQPELDKHADRLNLGIRADARAFMECLLDSSSEYAWDGWPYWLEHCQRWKARYPVAKEDTGPHGSKISTYSFCTALSRCIKAGDILAPGCSGAAVEIFYLAIEIAEGVRCVNSAALGAMGYGPPAALGACLASGGQRTICIDGDGGFQLNVQELATIKGLELPIKFFIINNDGYASIRNSQRRYFNRLIAADASSGLSLPSLKRVAEAYGFQYAVINEPPNLDVQIDAVLNADGPVLCEVMAPLEERRAPALGTSRRADGSLVSRPLEDLWPFLDREELRDNMMIDLIIESTDL
jgi:acetolactate synthase-1/2/3 large subunit